MATVGEVKESSSVVLGSTAGPESQVHIHRLTGGKHKFYLIFLCAHRCLKSKNEDSKEQLEVGAYILFGTKNDKFVDK